MIVDGDSKKERPGFRDNCHDVGQGDALSNEAVEQPDGQVINVTGVFAGGYGSRDELHSALSRMGIERGVVMQSSRQRDRHS